MKCWLLVILSSICSLTLSVALSAQNLDSASLDSLSKALLIDEVVVQENRIKIPFSDNSRSITLISKKEIQDLKPSSINELLQVAGGVDLRQRGRNGVQADVSIRGGTFEQTLVLLNGVRLLDPQTGHHMMNIPIDVSNIERIEILKGPAARIYGQNAFAGAINIITKTSTERNLFVGAEYGENGLLGLNASASLPVGIYNQTLSIAHDQSDGYRPNTDYTISNFFYQSQLPIGKGELKFFGGYVDRKFGANGFYGRESFTEQYEEVQTSIASLSYEQRLGDWNIVPKLSWRKNEDNWQFRRSDPEFFQNFHTTNVVTSEIQTSKTHKLGILGVGAEYNALSLESSNLKDSLDNGDHERTQLSLHLENRFLFFDEKLDATIGIMALSVSDEDLSIYPGLDLGYALSLGLKLYANVGWTSRIPSFTDLYYKDSGSVGNSELTQEKAFTSELGVKYSTGSFHLQASVFSRNATDQIDWFRVTEEDKWMPDNFNKATYAGLDLTTTYRPAIQSVLKSLRLSYTYINATFEDNDFAFSRNQLENLRHQLVLSPSLALGPVGLNVLAKYNDRVSLDDYLLVDANLNYQLGKQALFLKCNNLFDTDYRETNLVSMPGRWLSLGGRFQIL